MNPLTIDEPIIDIDAIDSLRDFIALGGDTPGVVSLAPEHRLEELYSAIIDKVCDDNGIPEAHRPTLEIEPMLGATIFASDNGTVVFRDAGSTDEAKVIYECADLSHDGSHFSELSNAKNGSYTGTCKCGKKIVVWATDG